MPSQAAGLEFLGRELAGAGVAGCGMWFSAGWFGARTGFSLNLQHLIEEVATTDLLQGFAWSTRWLGQAGQDHGVIESLLAQLRKVTFQLLAGGARA